MSNIDETKIFNITRGDIIKYSTNSRLIDYVQDQFKRLRRDGSTKLIVEILSNNVQIHHTHLTEAVGFKVLDRKKLDKETGNLKVEVIEELKKGIISLIKAMNKDFIEYDEDKDIKGSKVLIDKYTDYEKIRKFICDEHGKSKFIYNFDAPDLTVTPIQDKVGLQRCKIQITADPQTFNYPMEYIYQCPYCDTITKKKSYEVVSSRDKWICDGIYNYIAPNGESKSKNCKAVLSYDNETSITKLCYVYEINYEDENGENNSSNALSFEKLTPGFYECVLFKIGNPRTRQQYHIVDIKDLPSNIFNVPEKVEGENYLFTLQKSFDNFIKEKSGLEIYGLNPIKVAMIIQKVVSHFGFPLNMNIQIVGDTSTGKSMLLKYYGFLLYGSLNLESNGVSISVPALRGTRAVITLFNRDHKIITLGYLGCYRCIHIDEAGENRELVQNLKTFLADTNYSYDRAGASGAFKIRKAQVNLSENLDYAHIGQYRGSIKKAYNDNTNAIEGETQEEWNEDWDLHLPLFRYENPYLRKIVREKRLEYMQKKVFWIDGYDYALHERFPFYFYLVNQKKDEELIKVVRGNACRNTIEENLALIKALKSNDIDNFFESLRKHKDGVCDDRFFLKVDEILDEYGIEADARMRKIYYLIVRISQIVNQRMVIQDEDYELLKWFLEKINCKMDVADTADYKVVGPPNIEEQKRKDEEINEKVKSDSDFGLPDGEFN